MRKIILHTFLCLFLLFPQTVWATTIGETVTETKLLEGITHTNVHRFTTSGWIHYNVIRADLNNPYIALSLLSGNGNVQEATNVYDMAKRHNTDAAINTDFFQRSGSNSFSVAPLGTVIADGQLWSTPALDPSYATFALTKEGQAAFGYWTYDITLTAENKLTSPVRLINKFNDSGEGIVLYNQYWGSYSPGTKGENQFEVLVEKDMVKGIYQNEDPVPIPKDGYVLACYLDRDTFLLDHVKVGDKLKLDIKSSPSFSDFQLATGGGTLLVQNGKIAPVTHTVSGVQPRTALGSDRSGKIIYFVTVDGRQAISRGASMTELSNFMIELGCYTAINMDGGGSTTLILKNQENGEQEVANHPSGGSLRTVSVGLGVQNTAPISQTPASLEIKSEWENIFLTTSALVEAKVFDAQYHVLPTPEGIQWKVTEGKGYMEGNRFYPTSTGKVTLSASYQGLSASRSFSVLQNPACLDIYPREMELDSHGIGWVTVTAKDENGVEARILLDDTSYAFTPNIVTSPDGVALHPTASGTTLLAATLNDKTAYCKVSVGKNSDAVSLPENSPMTDTAYQEVEQPDFSFSVFGDSKKPDTMLSLMMYNLLIGKINQNAELATFVGSFPETQKADIQVPKLSAKGYGISKIEGSTFLRIDTSAGGIRETNPDQWLSILQDFPKIDTKNVFILLPRSIDEDTFTDRWEWNLFEEKLEELAIRHKVYVFYSEPHTDTFLFDKKNGVSYLGIRGFHDTAYAPMLQLFPTAGYLHVSIKDNQVTYQYRHI